MTKGRQKTEVGDRERERVTRGSCTRQKDQVTVQLEYGLSLGRTSSRLREGSCLRGGGVDKY